MSNNFNRFQSFVLVFVVFCIFPVFQCFDVCSSLGVFLCVLQVFPNVPVSLVVLNVHPRTVDWCWLTGLNFLVWFPIPRLDQSYLVYAPPCFGGPELADLSPEQGS